MLRTNNTRKAAVSIKMFIKEFGEDFPEHVKERLMDLEVRGFLTRKDVPYRFDLKHVEHLQYEVNDSESLKMCSKEYSYGQFVVIEGALYFSDKCIESKDVMQCPMVDKIYSELGIDGSIADEAGNLKRITDDNIDFIVDSILSSCPEVSKKYKDILKEMLDRVNNK